jgi:mono/diheme cytochrome c family protein
VLNFFRVTIVILVAIIFLAITWVVASAVEGKQDDTHRTVWEGVYTSEQAASGQGEYGAYCAECHGNTLNGRSAPALKGDIFWRDWGEETLNVLYDSIRTTMPAADPGSLSSKTYLEIVAYILRENDLPAGTEELDRLKIPAIRVVQDNDSY